MLPTHVSEAIVIILRYIDDGWCIQQRVAKLYVWIRINPGISTEIARVTRW